MSEERYYNLSYSHDKIDELLKKLDLGEVLSKEQYHQLIRDIGLDNISVFDLNYYNLKNIPTIPVRVSELFNDSKYDTVPNVTRQIEELYQLLEDEVTRIDGTIGQMNILDIQEVLTDLEEAQYKIIELNEQIDISNNAIFSVERIVESINDRTAGLLLDMNNLSSTQQNDLLMITRAQSILNIHSEQIDDMLFLIEQLQNKLNQKAEDFKALEERISLFKYFDDSFQEAVNTLKDGITGLESHYTRVANDIAALNDNIANYNADSVARFDALNVRFDDLDDRFELMKNDAIALIEDTVGELFDKVNDLEYNTNFVIDNAIVRLEDSIVDIEDSITKIQQDTSNIVDNKIETINRAVAVLDLNIKNNEINIQNMKTNIDESIGLLEQQIAAVQDEIPERLSQLENDLDLVTSLEIIKHTILTDAEYAALSDEEKRAQDVLHITIDTDPTLVNDWLNNILKR